MKHLFIALIKLYRMSLSKITPPCCRFTPSCSAYAITALERYGVFKGGFLAVKRIIKCNPFSKGGKDEVPLKRDRN